MAEKKKTATQQKIKYRALQYSTFVGEFLTLFTPFFVMGVVNRDEWFPDAVTGGKIATGGFLAMALLGLAVFLVSKNKEDKNKTSGYIALIVGWYATAFIFVLLADIIEQIATIMLFGGIGLCSAFGLDMFSKDFKAKADAYKEGIKAAKMETIKEQAKEEIKNGDVKF